MTIYSYPNLITKLTSIAMSAMLSIGSLIAINLRAQTVLSGEQGLPYFLTSDVVKFREHKTGRDLQIKDASGNIMGIIRSGARGETRQLALPPGYYEIDTEDSTDGSDVAKESFLVGLPRKDIPSVVGLDAHLVEIKSAGGQTFEQRLPQLLHAAKFAGTWHLRDRFRWGNFEPEEGNWNQGAFKRLFQPQLDAGFHLILAVEGNTTWSAAIPSSTNLAHPKEDALKKLFARLISLSAGKPVFWQIWNEPNPIGIAGSRYPGRITPQKYVDHFLRPAWEGASTATTGNSKTESLMIGGSAGMDLPWQEGIIKAGALRYVAAYDLHPYAVTPRQFEIQMRKVIDLLDREGFSGPVFGSEFHAKIPDTTTQMYVAWFSMDERMRRGSLMNFDLQDWQVGSSIQKPLTMGIIRSDYSPKPAMAAMNIVAHRLAGASHIKTVSETDNESVHLIRNSDGKLFATAYAHEKFRCLTFTTSAKVVTLVSAVGGKPRVVKTSGGMFLVPLKKGEFSYIDGIEDIEMVTDFVRVGESASLTSDEDGAVSSLPLIFTNVSTVAVEMEMSATSRNEGRARVSKSTLHLPPNEKTKDEIKLSPTGKEIEVGQHEVDLSLKTHPSGDEVKLPLQILVDPGYKLSLSIERGTSSKLNTLAVNVDGHPAPMGITVFEEIDFQKLMPLGQRNGTWRYQFAKEIATNDRSIPVTVKIHGRQGPVYLYRVDVGGLNAVESRLDENMKQDVPLNRYIAQPFKTTGNTLSAVSLRMNNWSQENRSIAISIRKGKPDGEEIAKATAIAQAKSSNWLMFSFPLVRDVTVGETFWIVTETAFPDAQLRWVGRNPHRERITNALSSYEGAAWNPLDPKDLRWMGFSHRIYR